MKIKVLQENLKQSLSYLQKVIPNKPQLPILSSILLKVEANKLLISATDLYLGIKTDLIVEVETGGSIVVNGEIFKNLINSLSPGKIDLELKENSLLISQGKTKTKLACQSAEEYPQFPEVEGDEFTFALSDLEKIQSLVSFATSNDQTRPILTSILMNFSENGLEVVATDGFRLAQLLFKQNKFELNKQLLVPAKALNELYRIAKQIEAEEVKILVSDELKQLLFKVANVEMYVRLIEGDYPPYEKIIPPAFAIEIEMDAEEFLTQLKRAFIFAKDASNIVRLNFNKDFLEVKSISPSFGEYKGEMAIGNAASEEAEIAFNVHYLIDFINTVKPEKLVFSMNESLKPAMFKDPATADYIYIAMPFRVNQ
jgi:DNA polymerase-3 subunit beta